MTRLYRKRPRVANCSICGIGSSTLILHFNLMRTSFVDGRWRSRGAGAIDLCEDCWRRATRVAAIRRRPERAA